MVDSNVNIEFTWNSEEHYLLVAECQQTSSNEFDVYIKVSGCDVTYFYLKVDSLDDLYNKVLTWFKNAKFL